MTHSYPLDVGTCNPACTNSDHKPKTRPVWPTSLSEKCLYIYTCICATSWVSQPCAVCYLYLLWFNLICTLYVLPCMSQ